MRRAPQADTAIVAMPNAGRFLKTNFIIMVVMRVVAIPFHAIGIKRSLACTDNTGETPDITFTSFPTGGKPRFMAERLTV
jgi:hypothetical protein